MYVNIFELNCDAYEMNKPIQTLNKSPRQNRYVQFFAVREKINIYINDWTRWNVEILRTKVYIKKRFLIVMHKKTM